MGSQTQVMRGALAIAALAFTGAALAQAWPSRPLRVIVPTAAIGYVQIGAEQRGRVGFGSI